MFVTQTTLSNVDADQIREEKQTKNEAQEVKRAEKEYIKHYLFAVLHCLVFFFFAHSQLAKMMCC